MPLSGCVNGNWHDWTPGKVACHDRSIQRDQNKCKKYKHNNTERILRKQMNDHNPTFLYINYLGGDVPAKKLWGWCFLILCFCFFPSGFCVLFYFSVLGSCVHISALEGFSQKDNSSGEAKEYYRCIFEVLKKMHSGSLPFWWTIPSGCFQCADFLQINSAIPKFF